MAQNGPRPQERSAPPPVSLVELYETYDIQFRSKLLDALYELTPTQFEHFARLGLRCGHVVFETKHFRRRAESVEHNTLHGDFL